MKHGRYWIAGLAMTLLLNPGHLRAQAAVGVKAGANYTSLTGSQDVDAIVGISAGGYLGFGIGDRVALQVEASYGVRGANGLRVQDGELNVDAAPSDIRLTAVEVPVLLRAGFPSRRFLPSVFMGPYVSFLVSCRLTPEGGVAGDCDDETRPSRITPRSTGYGLMAGAGMDFGLGESTIFVDARYVLGLVSIEGGSDPIDAYHGGLTVTGGFAFPLGR
ncbi:MAG TPA: porin family protein [Longimicrobiales bacterium]|nr:porin family protein [Longimicrobiales bacterium]